MHIIGIICEYNPFHNGHLYHLNKIKELFPNSLIILILNGYFTQRGDLSILSKKDKTLISLQNNIDLIIELPFIFGTQSADTFANTSLYILNKLKCEYLVFGSESNDIDSIIKMVNYTIDNKEEYNKEVKKYLDAGYNYPTSLAKALNMNFNFKSNDLLGISYVKSIIENKYHIKPLTIERTNDYLDLLDNSEIVSATNIRNKLLNNENIEKYLPQRENIQKISLNNYFDYLKYKIITDDHLDRYLSVDEGIDNCLKKVINEVNNIEELIEKVKSKRYTYNKIRRMLVHILMGLTKEDNQNIKMDYIKVLGFNNKGKDYLNKIKKDLDISLIPNKDSLVYQYELRCASIYDLVVKEDNLKWEKSNKPLKYK